MAGYPNLFVCVGPGSPAVLATYPTQIELQVGWIAEFVRFMNEQGLTRAEAEVEAQAEWTAHVNEVADGTMFTAASCNSSPDSPTPPAASRSPGSSPCRWSPSPSPSP